MGIKGAFVNLIGNLQFLRNHTVYLKQAVKNAESQIVTRSCQIYSKSQRELRELDKRIRESYSNQDNQLRMRAHIKKSQGKCIWLEALLKLCKEIYPQK